ncbi:MAG: hypothetical protein LBD73_07880 [Deferribacteraceae bacterium]|jgi:flagellar biosynthesis/type III secretory pathway protein FliH|nr:hypothetical protein [Deferribacteraceae bacterium]
MKVIKHSSNLHIEPYCIEQFSREAGLEQGEHHYRLISFGDEKSIQDNALEKKIKGAGGAGIFTSPPKKRKSLFSAYDDEEDTGIFSNYTGIPPHKNAEAMATRGTNEQIQSESQKLLEQIFSRDLTETGISDSGETGSFQDFNFNEEVPQNLNLVASQKEIVEKNSEITGLETQINELLNEISNLNSQISTLSDEKGELEGRVASIATLCDKAKEDGYNDGYAAAKKEFDRIQKALYEADKADYLQKMEEDWAEAIKEIQKVRELIGEIDREMPEIVLSYVREIVGTERKLNDAIIVNVVRQALSHLKDLQQIVFSVNAADAQIIAENFPQYGVSIDASVPKGSVKVRTKIGEVSLSIDNWMENLQKQIDEQLAAAKENQAQE